MIGWICTYTPEEIFTTLGLHSSRLYGTEEQNLKISLLPVNFCPYARFCLNEGLGKLRASLSGVIFTTSCHGLVHLYNSFEYFYRSAKKQFFTYLLELPHLGGRQKDSSFLKYFASCLAGLVEHLCKFYGVKWDQDAFRGAFVLHQEVRIFLRELYQFQREHPDQMRAAGVLEVVRYASQEHKEKVNRVLAKVLKVLRGGVHNSFESDVELLLDKLLRKSFSQGPRLLLVGSPLSLAYVDLVEELGGIVIGDDFCQGYRYCLPELEEGPDPYYSLARSYLWRLPCPRMVSSSERMTYLQDLVRKSEVQGVIYHTLKFCDSYIYEYVQVRNFFQKIGLPVLCLETDYRQGGIEQARTRLQAFLEMLR